MCHWCGHRPSLFRSRSDWSCQTGPELRFPGWKFCPSRFLRWKGCLFAEFPKCVISFVTRWLLSVGLFSLSQHDWHSLSCSRCYCWNHRCSHSAVKTQPFVCLTPVENCCASQRLLWLLCFQIIGAQWVFFYVDLIFPLQQLLWVGVHVCVHFLINLLPKNQITIMVTNEGTFHLTNHIECVYLCASVWFGHQYTQT